MPEPSLLMLHILFGAIGCGYFIYGKKRRALVPLVIGLSLCVVPYFLPNIFWLIGVGVSLAVIPYFIRN
jgi:hypothetical protein